MLIFSTFFKQKIQSRETIMKSLTSRHFEIMAVATVLYRKRKTTFSQHCKKLGTSKQKQIGIVVLKKEVMSSLYQANAMRVVNEDYCDSGKSQQGRNAVKSGCVFYGRSSKVGFLSTEELENIVGFYWRKPVQFYGEEQDGLKEERCFDFGTQQNRALFLKQIYCRNSQTGEVKGEPTMK